LIDHN